MAIVKRKITGEISHEVTENLRHVAKTRDEAIDYSDIPELTDDFWKGVDEWRKPEKEPIALRLDSDVVAFFRSQGRGYQTRINEVLRHYMSHAPRRAPRRASAK